MKKFIIIFLLTIFLIVGGIGAYIGLEYQKFSKENKGANLKYIVKLLFITKYSSSDYIKYTNKKPLEEHTKINIVIPKKSVLEIAKLLKKNKVITDVKSFVIFVRLKAMDKSIKNGEFEFYTDLLPKDVLKVLIEGKEAQYKVTLPENLTYQEIAALLEKAEVTKADAFIKLCESDDILKKYGVEYVKPKDRKNYIATLEGYLYPETYNFKHWTKPEIVLDRLVNSMKEKIAVYDKERKALGWSVHELLTIASIIGKETTTDSERFKVSSVFHNRLNIKMLLQTDPTVIYQVTGRKSSKYHAAITKKMLEDRSNPYNTYIYKGLPPGPIGNPNYKSIEAALKPVKTKYLYFVSNNDGTHTFTTTYENHLKAVEKYWQKVKKAQKK
jgi:UPF0755 protein